ncbi:S1 family peptidase [Renibacterium salmoninarum]|nr:trypsin-like serine protease [Renibacterium salmoninarum]
MKKVLKSVLIGAAAASLALVGAGAATAAPVGSGSASPDIVGGTKSAPTPWAVQLIFQQPGESGSFGCTGEAISSEWILTAGHCVKGDTGMKVYFSNSTSDRGVGIAVDDFYSQPDNDDALVHLSQAKELSAYPTMTDGYQINTNDAALIMGYGRRANSVNSDGLYQAKMRVPGASSDTAGGPAIHLQGINGGANHGDSGGPLIIGNKIVGVASTVDSGPGASTTGKSNYASVSDARDWIQNTTGI